MKSPAAHKSTCRHVPPHLSESDAGLILSTIASIFIIIIIFNKIKLVHPYMFLFQPLFRLYLSTPSQVSYLMALLGHSELG